MKTISVLLLLAAAASAQVPAQYQAIYSNIQSQLSTFDTQLKTGWNGNKYPYLPAPQLLNASSDLYTEILNPYQFSNSIDPQLNDFVALGAKAITIHIDIPVLYLPYYTANNNANGGQLQFNAFVAFYQQLMADIHGRGLKVIVETEAGTAITGTMDFGPYYQSLSWTDYQTARAQTALNIVQLVQPDYITVITEPDSEATNSYQPNAGTLAGSLQLLQTILAALQPYRSPAVSVGAGAGTWITSYTSYVSEFLTQPLDFLDIHIYPVNDNYLPLAVTGAQMAQAAGKKVAMSEFWDWKIADSELASINLSIIESRSTFGFWAPVDEQMIKTMQDFAQISNLEFSSPYWDHYFMAYLDYPTYQSYSPSALLNASYAAVVAAVGIGTYTPTGHYYEQMYLSPDTQAPSVPSAPSVSPGYTTAAVSWAPSSDNVGTAGYLIYRNGAYIQRINALVLYDSGLSQGTQYSYSVAAFDASGNISQQSGATSVKTYTGNQNSPRRLRLARKNGRVN